MAVYANSLKIKTIHFRNVIPPESLKGMLVRHPFVIENQLITWTYS